MTMLLKENRKQTSFGHRSKSTIEVYNHIDCFPTATYTLDSQTVFSFINYWLASII